MASSSSRSSLANPLAITGVSGYLGQRLLHALSSEPSAGPVVGIDLRPSPLASPSLHFIPMDVCDPALAGLLRAERVDALAHLAFIMQPIHDRRRMRTVNVEGTRAVLEAAARAGVSQVVIMSSVAVYGAHSRNPIPLTEESPLHPNSDYSYALDKAAMEKTAQDFAACHPHIAITILRTAIVLGPHVDNFFSRYLSRWPLMLAARGSDGPMQFVHEDDVVACILACLRQRARGIYNLAGAGMIGWREVLKQAQRRYMTLPAWWVYAVAWCLWQTRLPDVAPPGQLAWVRFPSVVSTEKIAREVGFRPLYTTEDAFADWLKAARTPESLPHR